MPKRKAPEATNVLVVGAGGWGQAKIKDAPGYKKGATKKLKKGIWALSGTAKEFKAGAFASLPFSISWLEYNESNGLLYAAGDDEKLHSLRLMMQNGKLTAKVISSSNTMGGSAHFTIHPEGAWAITANYGSGLLCVLPLAADGAIGDASDSKQPWPLDGLDPDLADRQEACHPHQVLLDPTLSKWALACDLGADCVWVYQFNKANGGLLGAVNSSRHLQLPRGSGPRHLAFHPNKKWVYILCELSGKVRTARQQ